MNFKQKNITIRNLKSNQIVSQLNLPDLHRYIMQKISIEFSGMVNDCYYPKIAVLYKELLYKTNSSESDLIAYAKDKYKNLPHAGAKNLYTVLYNPYNTLLVIIIQEFLKQNDMAGAEAAFHLFALRHYTNLLYKYTTKKSKGSKPLCVPEYFKAALTQLSRNHIFSLKRTIANSVMYFSRTIFKKYLKEIKKDDAVKIALIIYEIRSRLNQSMQSFFNKYYEIAEKKDLVKTQDEEIWSLTHETQIRNFIDRITKDICVYKKINDDAINQSTSITKFNKKIAAKYIKELSNPKYVDNVNTAYFLMLKNVRDLSIIKKPEFIKYIKQMMAIKTTKQPLYFKKVITSIHDDIILKLELTNWFANLSIQSKAISRNFISYYLAFYLRNYV